MAHETHDHEPREIPVLAALVPVLALIGFLSGVILVLPRFFEGFEGSGHLPLILAAAVACIIGRVYGWKWEELQAGMLGAIHMAMGAILILLVIGVLMGTWLVSGIVPALIDWGLLLLRPSFFLPATCAVCSVVSLVSGSSWSTAGTVGVALIGVGGAMGVPAPLTAGAVISGAYFGDKLSPMSDTTNLAPAMAGTDLFTHVRHMLWTTGPSWVVAMIAYTAIGLTVDVEPTVGSIAEIHGLLAARYRPGIIHLLAPAVVGVLIYFRMPALPTLFAGAMVGVLLALLQGTTADIILESAMSGYQPDTGNAELDDLLARGGLMSMANTVVLILAAMVFGGVMERTGMLRVLASRLLAAAQSTGSLIAATVLTSIAINILAADQYISVVVPGRMYAEAYRDRGLHPKNLSRALEDGGTITSPLIPWNTCGAYMSTTLGVATGAYLPYAFLNLLNPVLSIAYGFLGFTITPLDPDEGGGDVESDVPGGPPASPA